MRDTVIGRDEGLSSLGTSVIAATEADLRPCSPVTRLHHMGKSGNLECYFIPAPAGLRADSYRLMTEFLEELVSFFVARRGYYHESFIQMGQARDQQTSHLFSDHAREWIPEMGLGVWPSRPAPRMWKMEDIEDMDPEKGMGTVMHSLFRVTADEKARLNAMSVMLGTGSSLQILSAVENKILLRDLKEAFLGFIQDRVFRIFPWYIPLLERANCGAAPEPFLTIIMRDISLYIRESPEDQGVLILSVQPLTALLAQLGYKQIENDNSPKWTLER